MIRTLMGSFIAAIAIAAAMPATAATPASPKTRTIAYNMTALRTPEGAAAFRKQVRAAIEKVCAVSGLPDYRSSIERACRTVTNQDFKPKVNQILARANETEHLATADTVLVASR